MTLGALWLSWALLLVWTPPPGYAAVSTLPLCATESTALPRGVGLTPGHQNPCDGFLYIPSFPVHFNPEKE